MIAALGRPSCVSAGLFCDGLSHPWPPGSGQKVLWRQEAHEFLGIFSPPNKNPHNKQDFSVSYAQRFCGSSGCFYDIQSLLCVIFWLVQEVSNFRLHTIQITAGSENQPQDRAEWSVSRYIRRLHSPRGQMKDRSPCSAFSTIPFFVSSDKLSI